MTLSSYLLLVVLPTFSLAVAYRVAMWPRLIQKPGRSIPEIDRPTLVCVAGLISILVSLAPWLAYDGLGIGMLAGFAVIGGSLAGHDLRRGLLPHAEMLLLGVLGGVWALLQNTLSDAITGAFAGYLLMASLNFGWRRAGRAKQAIGSGDVNLTGVLGLWLGVGSLGWTLLISAIIALIASPWHGRNGKLRFGPYLVATAFCVLVRKGLGYF